MNHTFCIIATKLELHPDGYIARGPLGNAKITQITIRIEAETLEAAELIAKEITDNIGNDWLDARICSEAELMADSGYPAFFDMEVLKGVKRLKGAIQ